MKKVSFFVFYLIISYLSLHNSVLAQKISTSELEVMVQNYVSKLYKEENTIKKAKIQVLKPKISSRVENHSCDSDIKFDVIHRSGRNINIKVSCTQPLLWRLYIPLKVTKLLPVLVSSSNLNKGTVLTNENTKINYIEEYKIRGAVLDTNKNILGAKIKRNLQKENPIYNSHICTVCKGEMVTIIAKAPSFNIKTEGMALGNANINEQVNVKNNRSGKVISARVNSINKVVINL